MRLALLACCLVAHAADKHVAFTDPATAGPDFLVQGEYTGTLSNGAVIAAQVIASGNSKFEGVLYLGGLPGAGWDEKIRFHFKGEAQGDTTQFIGIHGERLMFENPLLQATLRNGEFRGQAEMFRNIADDTTFTMKKVHRQSPTLGAQPPPGAIVLFDGTNTNEWINGKLLDGGLLDVGTDSKRRFNSMQLHLEFRTPFMPTAPGMARGNSGVYIKRIWEVQIIDSFGWDEENRKFERLSDFAPSGGIHEMVKPRLNMSFPPLSWQTLDIDFIDVRFDQAGNKLSPAMLSVRLNGILVQDRFVLPPSTPAANPKKINERDPGPLYLQNHHNPVQFRNIWVLDKK